MPIKVLRMADLELRGKRVLIREDLNVPVQNRQVTSDARIRAALPTIETARRAGARVMVMSHLGRPEEGVHDAEFSLAPVAARLSELLGVKVRLVRDWLDGVDCEPGQVVRGAVPCTSAVMRMPLAGGQLEVVAWSLRDPFGLVFD